MRRLIIVLALFGISGLAHAQTGALGFSDVTHWGNWRGKITSFDLQASVEGLVSRNVLTLAFQDFESNQSDSLEMAYSFSLPKGSVVDSLYLWIGEEKQPAALKSIWTAWQIYGSIVKRRWDPALLTALGNDNYQLRVFPFSRGQERRVQICYTTPLVPFFDRLRMEIPLQLTLPSAQPTGSLRAEIRLAGIGKGNITVSSAQPEAWETTQNGEDAHLAFRTSGRTFQEAAYVLIERPDYAKDGIAVHFDVDKTGETHFMALMNPRKALGLASAKKKRKLLVLWNAVSSYPDMEWTGTRYNYHGTRYSYPYDANVVKEGRDLVDFLQSNLAIGDEVNFMFNDLAIKGFHSGLAAVDEGIFPELRSFIGENLAQTQSQSPDGKGPADLLAEGLRSLKGIAGAELLLIDRYSQAYWWDSAYSDGVDGKALLAAAPESLTAYVVAATSATASNAWPTNLAKAYQNLARNTGGALINSGYRYYPIGPVLEGLKPFFSMRIYPAALAFSAGASGFAYDIFGVPDMFYLDQNLVVTGKLSLPTTLPEPGQPPQIMTIRFQGKSEGKDVSLAKDVRVARTTTAAYLSKLWGANKVASILQNGYYSPRLWDEATDWSLRYRILTPVTALMALEPGRFDSAWYQDQQPTNGAGAPTRLVQDGKSASVTLALALEPGFLVLDLSGLGARRTAKDFSLQIYDARGRMVANLSALAKREGKSLRWSTRSLPKGVYVLRMLGDGKTLSKAFSIR